MSVIILCKAAVLTEPNELKQLPGFKTNSQRPLLIKKRCGVKSN